MAAKKSEVPCVVCNPKEAQPGEYCEKHGEDLHRLDHQMETFFRLHRISRGKGHETYDMFLQGECDPLGRVIVSETDPENLSITVLLSDEVDLDSKISEYQDLGIEKSYGDHLKNRIQLEIVHSWYGNARACVDVFRVSQYNPQHWDIDQRIESEDDEGGIAHPSTGGKHSVH
jgi:hypothetical protein